MVWYSHLVEEQTRRQLERAPDMTENGVHRIFFNIEGTALEHAQYKSLYPDGREQIAYDRVCGFEVSTEFVGINHNPDPDGKPYIFETLVQLDGREFYSTWAVSYQHATGVHARACWLTRAMCGVWYATAFWRRAVR